jgi:hypothetical protein
MPECRGLIEHIDRRPSETAAGASAAGGLETGARNTRHDSAPARSFSSGIIGCYPAAYPEENFVYSIQIVFHCQGKILAQSYGMEKIF